MIIVRIYEGLGNQMFEYAYAYALSRRKGYREKVHIDIRDKEVSEWDKKRIYRPLEINQFCISLPIASKVKKMELYREFIDNAENYLPISAKRYMEV